MRFALTLLALAAAVWGQTAPSPAGKWNLAAKVFDDTNYEHMELALDGTKLTGKIGGRTFEGTFQGDRLEGTFKLNPQTTVKLEGGLHGDRLSGTGTILEEKVHITWEARRDAPRASGAPQNHTFEPTVFQHFFSDAIEPVLHVNPEAIR
jgi:hypothetical protein